MGAGKIARANGKRINVKLENNKRGDSEDKKGNSTENKPETQGAENEGIKV